MSLCWFNLLKIALLLIKMKLFLISVYLTKPPESMLLPIADVIENRMKTQLKEKYFSFSIDETENKF